MAKIHRGIVISTSEASKQFYLDCFKSLEGCPYPVYFSYEGAQRPQGSFELGAIQNGKEMFHEFVYLHDTVVIKDITLFEKLFAIEGNVVLTTNGYHYFGKYVSDLLPDLPVVTNKQEAIHWELKWLPKPYTVFTPELPFVSNTFEEKYGRLNMVLENDYLIKWKGTWS